MRQVAPAPPTESEQLRIAADRAIARLPAVRELIAQLRQLDFKIDVPAAVQSAADFRAHIEAEIPRELPPAYAANLAAALAHIGVLREPIDLARAAADAIVGQAAAYYDNKQKAFFIVQVQKDNLDADIFNAHELVHALQDQHFDLGRYYQQEIPKQQRTLSEDEMNARGFVVEGDATFSMYAFRFAAIGQDPLAPGTLAILGKLIERMASATPDQLAALVGGARGGDDDDDLAKAAEDLARIPLYLRMPMLGAYLAGPLPILVAYQHGGWPEVNRLYTTPPESTEQLLHPREKLVPSRDLPSTITFDAPAAATLLHSDVLGELGWSIYFHEWLPEHARAAAAGWDGDRYAVFRADDGSTIGIAVTTWDTPADAQEFERAYLASLAVRLKAAGPARGQRPAARRPDGTSVWVRRRGSDVFIVDGAATPKALGTVMRRTRVVRR